ncbi:MAG TPA: ABC transporter transmembrane domain-containing protein, partial [Actinotalea sp.]|nr:ABC transporter transmembrane domain-containing protein [Actinotalea sp.]
MKLPVADPTMLREHTLGLLRRHRGALGLVLVLHALAAVAGLAGPWLLGRIVDAVAVGADPSFVDRATLALVAAVLAQTLLTRYAQRASRVLGETVFADLREDFITTVTRLPLSTVERAGTGDLVGRTTNDIDRAQHSVRFGVPQILVTSATTVLTLVAAFAVDWRVAFAILVGVPTLVLSTRW